ncbi:phosphate signaling complex protein PhoU [Bacillaceae bacterium SIJ1]|uniref:phosphate signaling complex protein PhoU n=1 Tax=Litoribacterium kuwaitense TaxID=1398745 RepID=UPI0013EB8B02|nr:phosphate signaling complex protein PhoU [Litoribacterium kuwaitense]NGP46360.1 phosphate signaling complex protein PhoU [Litoribacterium kuwaitense]
MSLRQSFEDDLAELHAMLLRMGMKAKESLSRSMSALKNQNVESAIQVIEYDPKINQLEDDINEKAIWLIAKQQPLASDLRKLMMTVKIASDIERIGDLSVNIAKSTVLIGKDPLFKPLNDIPAMAERVTSMFTDSLDAFHHEDVVLARGIADADDEVDHTYGRLINELMRTMAERPELIQQLTQLSFISRYLERIGDHTTNIAENVIYLVKGKMYDLND